MNWTQDRIDYIRKWGRRKTVKELQAYFGVSKGAITAAVSRYCKEVDHTHTPEIPLKRDLKGARCKFLGGDAKPFTECNKLIVRGSYCEEHAKLCYTERDKSKPIDFYSFKGR